MRGGTDNTIPFVHVTSIKATEVHPSHKLPVAGYVTDESKLRSLSIQVEPKEGDKYPAQSVKFNRNPLGEYEFATEVTVK
ncbi:hypothetical protein RYX45_24415, partial [Alkalihalophilus pseudofirmus]